MAIGSARGSVGWADVLGGLSKASLTGVTLGFQSGIGAHDPFSQILTGAVGGFRSGGARPGTAIGNALGGGVRPGLAGALYGGGIAALSPSGRGGLSTIGQIAGGGLGLSIAPGVSIGFSLPGATAYRQRAIAARGVRLSRAAAVTMQRRSAPAAGRLGLAGCRFFGVETSV